MTWYVHRRQDGSIASAHQEMQPGYAEEALKDDDAELAAILNPPPPPKPRDLAAEFDQFKAGLKSAKSIADINAAATVDAATAEALAR